MKRTTLPTHAVKALLAGILLFGVSAANAAVTVKAVTGGAEVTITDKRGIGSYWIFAKNFNGPILGVDVGVTSWWFRCPKSTTVTVKIPPALLGAPIVVKYLPCGTSVPEDYRSTSLTTQPAKATPISNSLGTQVDEDGNSFQVVDYEGGFMVLSDKGDGTLSLRGNYPLPLAMDIDPLDIELPGIAPIWPIDPQTRTSVTGDFGN